MTKREFEFNKNSKGEWWLDLPEWKGDPTDLQMMEGADEWLNLISDNHNKVELKMSDQPYNGAEVLTLLRIREANFGGGGIYYLDTYKSGKVGLKLWLCDVTSFVFDHIPQKIYFSMKS